MCPMKSVRSWPHASWITNDETFLNKTFDSPSRKTVKKEKKKKNATAKLFGG